MYREDRRGNDDKPRRGTKRRGDDKPRRGAKRRGGARERSRRPQAMTSPEVVHATARFWRHQENNNDVRLLHHIIGGEALGRMREERRTAPP